MEGPTLALAGISQTQNEPFSCLTVIITALLSTRTFSMTSNHAVLVRWAFVYRSSCFYCVVFGQAPEPDGLLSCCIIHLAIKLILLIYLQLMSFCQSVTQTFEVVEFP